MPNGTWNRLAALILTGSGMGPAFGTMIRFGIGRAFGLRATSLRRTGIYRYSRNPQMVGGWLMVLGVIFYEVSAYAIGWLLVWAIIGHWMVATEEEHLRRVFGGKYDQYCRDTPRYLTLRGS